MVANGPTNYHNYCLLLPGREDPNQIFGLILPQKVKTALEIS